MPKRKQQPADDQSPPHDEDSSLVPMVKDGEVLKIHPRAVAEHEQLGWKRQ